MTRFRIYTVLYISITAAAAALLMLAAAPATAEVTYSKKNVDGIECHVLEIPLASKKFRIDVDVAQNFPGTDESFEHFVDRIKPVAAVNGTFFCKNDLKPVGDIVKNGRQLHFGGLGTAVCVTKNNEVEFVDVPLWKHVDWTKYLTVLAAGPRLVTNGHITVFPREQGFTDPAVLGSANRMAIGLTQKGTMVWVAVRRAISLERTAAIMQALGCTQAMNSDGGASQAMYFKGGYVIRAQRRLTNVIYVVPYKRPADALIGVSASASQAVTADEHFNRGQNFASKQDWSAAIGEYRMAISLDPNQAAFYNSLGVAYSATGNLKEQAIALRQAGKIYVIKGLYDTAIAKLLQAVKIMDNDPETYRSLSKAYDGKGEIELSIKMLKEAEKYAFLNNAIQSGGAVASVKSGELSAFSMQSLESAPSGGEEPDAQESGLSGLEPEAPGFSEFDGYFGDSGREYYEFNLGFTLYWPEEWHAEASPKRMLVVLSHQSEAYYGALQAFPVREDVSIEEFERRFIAGSYKSEIRRYETALGGYPALRTLYEEIINDRSTGQQYFYVKKGSWMIVITLMTYAEHYADAAPEFAAIVKNFRLN